MADRIVIDIGILQGIFGDLTKLQQQIGGIAPVVAGVDRAASQAFAGVSQSVRGAQGAMAGLENGVDAGMRNIVADIMGPMAKVQELEAKLARLGGEERTSKSVGEIIKLKTEIRSTQRELDGVNTGALEQKVGGGVGRMRSMIGGLVAPVAAAFAVGGITNFSRSIVDAAAKSQSFDTSMRVMLKSKEKADELSAQVTSFAGETPFELGQLRNATTQLLAYQVSADKIIPTLESLGNIAAGVGMDKLPQLMTAFGQVKAAGKLTGGELRQFTEAGVPLLDELAKITGQSTASMAGNIAKLDIPFATVQQALTNLSSGNGQFANLMKMQSGTIGGQLSNLSDVWDKFKEDIGIQFAPEIMSGIELLKAGIDRLRGAFAWLKENWESITDVLYGIGVGMATYTALLLWNNKALIYNNVLQGIAAVKTGVLAAWTALTTGSLAGATAAQWSWNAALTANPIGLVIVAIGALVAGVIYAWNNFERFRMTLYGVWEAAKVVFSGIWNAASSAFDGIVQQAKGVATILEGAFALDFEKMKAGFKEVGDGLVKSYVTPFSELSDIGKKAGEAYGKGRIDGLVAFNADKKDAGSTPGVSAKDYAPGQDVGAAGIVGGTPPVVPGAKSKGDGVTVGGSGGSGRTITMDIKMTNTFNLPKDGNMGAREAAERIVGDLVKKLNDAQFAMG